jgi:hypothetical protein
LIEKKKWDYLADIRARTGAKTLYINATPQGIYQFDLGVTLYINATPQGIYQFDLGALIEPEWVLKSLPITTDFSNKAHSERLCGFFDIRLAELLLV